MTAAVTLIGLSQPEEVALGFQALESEFTGTYPWFAEWLAQTKIDVANGERRLYGIFNGKTLVGVFLINLVDQSTIKANAMVIWSKFRGRGFSVAAYQELFRQFDVTATYVYTQCKEGNAIARHLIERVGFIPIGRLRHLVEMAHDNLVYVRLLKPGISHRAYIQRASEIYTEPNVKEFIPTPPDC